MRRDDSNGRIRIHARSEWDEDDDCRSASAGMSAAITRPTTSSIIAALVSTVPILVCCNGTDGEDVIEHAETRDEGARTGLSSSCETWTVGWGSMTISVPG